MIFIFYTILSFIFFLKKKIISKNIYIYFFDMIFFLKTILSFILDNNTLSPHVLATYVCDRALCESQTFKKLKNSGFTSHLEYLGKARIAVFKQSHISLQHINNAQTCVRNCHVYTIKVNRLYHCYHGFSKILVSLY